MASHQGASFAPYDLGDVALVDLVLQILVKFQRLVQELRTVASERLHEA